MLFALAFTLAPTSLTSTINAQLLSDGFDEVAARGNFLRGAEQRIFVQTVGGGTRHLLVIVARETLVPEDRLRHFLLVLACESLVLRISHRLQGLRVVVAALQRDRPRLGVARLLLLLVAT